MDIKLTPDDWEKFAKEHGLTVPDLVAEMSYAIVTMVNTLIRINAIKNELDAQGNMPLVSYGPITLIYHEEMKH